MSPPDSDFPVDVVRNAGGSPEVWLFSADVLDEGRADDDEVGMPAMSASVARAASPIKVVGEGK